MNLDDKLQFIKKLKIIRDRLADLHYNNVSVAFDDELDALDELIKKLKSGEL